MNDKPDIIEINVLELLFTDPRVNNLFDKTKVITLLPITMDANKRVKRKKIDKG